MHKLNLTLIVIAGMTMLITSCSKEEIPFENTESKIYEPASSLKDTVTSFMVFFGNPKDSSAQVGVYDDPDGPGPKPASIGGVVLSPNTAYEVTFFIEDASNPASVAYLHNKIKANGTQFKICTNNPLGSNIQATDSDGKFPIGLENKMFTNENTGDSYMNFTIKYQKDVKNGSCTPGEVYFSVEIPVSIY